MAYLDGPQDLKLTSPASRADLAAYNPSGKTTPRYYCRDCGTHVFLKGYFEHGGHRTDLFWINIATVDQPQEGVELSKVRLRYTDLSHDNFSGGAKDGPWPGGLP